MTFVDLSQVIGESPDISQVLIAEQDKGSNPTAWTDETRRLEHVYKYVPGVNSGDLAVTGELIPNPVFTGDADQTKSQQGPQSIINGLNIAAANGAGWLYRNLLQDKKPTVTGSKYTVTLTAPIINTGSSDAEKQKVKETAQTATISDGQYVKVTATATNPTIGDTGVGILEVEGLAADSTTTIIDTLYFQGSATKATGELYFSSITKLRISGFTAGTFALQGVDDSREVEFTPDDDKPRSFLTVEYAKGSTPNTYYSCYIIQDTIEVRKSGLLQHALRFGGRRAELYKNFAGTADPTDIKAKLGDGTLVHAADDPFAGWQTAVRLGPGSSAPRMAMVDARILINQNWENSAVISGEPIEASPPIRIAKRAGQIQSNVLYSKSNRYDLFFKQNRTIDFVQVIMENKLPGAYPSRQVIMFRKMQLTANPDAAVVAGQEVRQPVGLQTVKARGVAALSIKCKFPEWEDVKDLSMY